MDDALRSTDPQIAELIDAEIRRQATQVRLIASENYVSDAVLAATGSVLTNKYSEGYPGKRYYEGQRVIDQVEELARSRATALFGADHANVQPYSGSVANLAAYAALAASRATPSWACPWTTGGHLTHGWKVSHDQQVLQIAVSVPRERPIRACSITTPGQRLWPRSTARKIASSPEPRRYPRI